MEDNAPSRGPFSDVAQLHRALVDRVGRDVHGAPETIDLAVVCLLAEGHLLIEGVPGVGKTTLARSLAQSFAGVLARIQFTADLLPGDITGISVFEGRGSWTFHEGPVFANIVIGDEINRGSPKAQSALLEVMQERQVTVDGRPRPVPSPFMVIATQNPRDHAGTFPLPEAQVDRFMARLTMTYPSDAATATIIDRHTAGGGRSNGERRPPPPAAPAATLGAMIERSRAVALLPNARDYIVELVRATRSLDRVRRGCSPRAAVALARAAQARAATRGRHHVTVDDVKHLAGPVLAHRLVTGSAEHAADGPGPGLVEGLLRTVPVPPARSGAPLR